MKDLLNVQDFLHSSHDVGDWEGEEEQVAENLNELIHVAWQEIPEDTPCELIEEIISGIWDFLRGDTAIIEADFEELIDWVKQYVFTSLDEKM